MRNIGITEAGDAGLDFSWVEKLYDVNIIISKFLTKENEKLISALLKNKEKIIFHCTCTGYGGTSQTGIKRCRYSVIDIYPHVKERFLHGYGETPFEGFHAPKYMMNEIRQLVSKYQNLYEFESCAENMPNQVGCISKKDFDILGVKFENGKGGFQRKGCLCAAGKKELLNNKKRCPAGCLYCYWKD